MTTSIRFSSALFTLKGSRLERRLPDTYSHMVQTASNYIDHPCDPVTSWHFPDTAQGQANQIKAAQELIQAGQPVVALPYFNIQDPKASTQFAQISDFIKFWAIQAVKTLGVDL